MDIDRFVKSPVIIIEGVPGAGKTILQERLCEAAQGRHASFYPEEALLFGWIHAWLPGIDALRMTLMHRVLDHIESSLAEYPGSLFVLTRFHLSYLNFAKTVDIEAYDRLIGRLRELSVLVLVPQIPESAIAGRALHVERTVPQWRAHLKKRLEHSGFRDIASMYSAEQSKVRQILATQQLRYEILDAIEP